VSLNGNLEDLPLLDILQIVTYSRKTGYLAIKTRGGDGAIVFQDGMIVAAVTPGGLPLTQADVAGRDRVAVIEQRISIALEQLVRLREGEFNFSLSDSPPKRIGDRDISAEILYEGINAQGLLLDLARGMDEDRRDSSAALEASFVQPPEVSPTDTPPPESVEDDLSLDVTVEEDSEIGPLPEEFSGVEFEALRAAAEPSITPLPSAPTPAPPDDAPPARPASAPAAGGPSGSAEEPWAVLLADDEAEVRHILGESFTKGGYQVIEADGAEAAVKKAHRLGKAAVRFIVVCDLGMPTSGGRSFQGGFEVVKRLWKMHLTPPILIMAESVSASLQARAKQMGVAAMVFKPGLSKLDPPQYQADLRAFAQKLLKDVMPHLGASSRALPAPRKAAAGAAGQGAVSDVAREMSVLHNRLEELRQQQDPTRISLLVMNMAREYFERGILFLIKNDEARGLAAFGQAPREENLSLLVRNVAIPLREPSLFLETVTSRKPFNGPLEGKWASYLYGHIGRFQSGAAVLLPLQAHRESIALLFGDNPETGREIALLETLALFVDQAGVALENVFLQRKIQALEERV
jgi:CheY-like chemotaxis protein